jgi:hypothetical protein
MNSRPLNLSSCIRQALGMPPPRRYRIGEVASGGAKWLALSVTINEGDLVCCSIRHRPASMWRSASAKCRCWTGSFMAMTVSITHRQRTLAASGSRPNGAHLLTHRVNGGKAPRDWGARALGSKPTGPGRPTFRTRHRNRSNVIGIALRRSLHSEGCYADRSHPRTSTASKIADLPKVRSDHAARRIDTRTPLRQPGSVQIRLRLWRDNREDNRSLGRVALDANISLAEQ